MRTGVPVLEMQKLAPFTHCAAAIQTSQIPILPLYRRKQAAYVVIRLRIWIFVHSPQQNMTLNKNSLKLEYNQIPLIVSSCSPPCEVDSKFSLVAYQILRHIDAYGTINSACVSRFRIWNGLLRGVKMKGSWLKRAIGKYPFLPMRRNYLCARTCLERSAVVFANVTDREIRSLAGFLHLLRLIP